MGTPCIDYRATVGLSGQISWPQTLDQTRKWNELIEFKKSNESFFCHINYGATVGLSGQRSWPRTPDQTNKWNWIKKKQWVFLLSYRLWSNSWLEWSKISAPIVDLWLKWQRSPMSMQPRISLYQNIMRTAPARISKPDYVVKMSPALCAAAAAWRAAAASRRTVA